jgi:hypothetical protein
VTGDVRQSLASLCATVVGLASLSLTSPRGVRTWEAGIGAGVLSVVEQRLDAVRAGVPARCLSPSGCTLVRVDPLTGDRTGTLHGESRPAHEAVQRPRVVFRNLDWLVARGREKRR